MAIAATVGVPLNQDRKMPAGVPFPIDVLVTGIPTGNGAGNTNDVTAVYGTNGLGVNKILGGTGCQDLAAAAASDTSITLTFASDGSKVSVTHAAGGDRRARLLLWVSL